MATLITGVSSIAMIESHPRLIVQTPCRSCSCVIADTVLPIGDLPFCLVSGYSVSFLNLADEHFSTTVDSREVVVRQLSPAFLHRALQLLPIAFDTIPVHDGSPP